MARVRRDYDDIPGTFVFDAERSRQGYGINMFCMSLLKKENREVFKTDEASYLNAYKLTQEQREAILGRQWNRMLQLGGNIYFTAKLSATDGLSFQQVAALMTGSTQQGYAEMMLRGGRPIDGNRRVGVERSWLRSSPGWDAHTFRLSGRRSISAKPKIHTGNGCSRGSSTPSNG
jgi:protocatechuate 4,5-dioxygenase alpha chain